MKTPLVINKSCAKRYKRLVITYNGQKRAVTPLQLFSYLSHKILVVRMNSNQLNALYDITILFSPVFQECGILQFSINGHPITLVDHQSAHLRQVFFNRISFKRMQWRREVSFLRRSLSSRIHRSSNLPNIGGLRESRLNNFRIRQGYDAIRFHGGFCLLGLPVFQSRQQRQRPL